jgi:hypothetical protein
MVITQQKPSLLENAWKLNKPLTILVLLSSFTFLFSLIGLFVDPRATAILGTPAWAKTFKFSISLALYAASLLWVLQFIELRFRRGAQVAASIIGTVMSLEMLLIAFQGLRAQPMHFNATTPFDAMLWQLMSIGVSIMLLGYIAMIVLVWRGFKSTPTIAWGVRAGLIVTLLSFFQGSLMTSPNAIQEKALLSGKTAMMIGAHTVGSSSLMPDAGAGLPLLGWSTEHGDLRIGHFVGIHALQLLPFFAVWLSRRRKDWLSVKQQIGLVGIAALGYTGLMLLVTWQALRGQSIIAPDLQTIGALLGLLGATALLSFSVVAHARAKS